jgi:hypothetical protein
MTHTTNYSNTFITVAPDSTAKTGTAPPEAATPTLARRAFRLIMDHPYRYTSDDVLFAVYAERTQIPENKRKATRIAFFSKPQACLRASDLCKKYGWGIHHDEKGRIAIYPIASAEYATLSAGKDLSGRTIVVKSAMRSKRDR